MKTLIIIIIFIAQVWQDKHYVYFNKPLRPTINIDSNLITVRSRFEHKEDKWVAVNKDSLKINQTFYYVLEENFSAKLIITKWRK